MSILAILWSLWGALAMLVGVSFLLLAGGASGIPGLAAGFTTAAFATMGLFALVWGGVHVWSAMQLRRLQPAGRITGLALALTDLLVLPFGTALGIYTLWVLLTNEGRRLFEPVK